MKHKKIRKVSSILIILAFNIFCSTFILAEECSWPQFHGSKRDNLSNDTGLLKQWPNEGPELLWKTTGIGHGFSTVSIANGMIYTAGNIEGNTVITAMDMDGTILWQTTSGPAFTRSYPGSRSTPTIDGDRLYHLNGNGYIICVKAKTGEEMWRLNVLEKFNGRNIEWGLSESVLVDGQNVICTPGGEEISVVALDRDTGETVWKCVGVGDKPGYVSPIIVDYKGLRQIVTMMSASVIGVNADTGKLLWKYDHPIKYDVNIVTPLYYEGHIIISATLAAGTTMLKLNVDGNSCAVEKVWHTEELDNEHGGIVLVDGYLYGQADGNHKWRHWACLKLETGEAMYSVEGLPTDRSGATTYADGMLYLLSDKGEVALMPANPEEFNIVSKFHLPKDVKGPAWAHPVVCGGRLYLRHGEFLYVHNVRAGEVTE